MSDGTEEVMRHGIRLQLPNAWADRSVYRYEVPVDRARPKMPAANPVPQLRPNVIVTRHPSPVEDLASVFEFANVEAKKTGANFEILGQTEVEFLGQAAIWQDSRQTETRTGLSVHQRHVVVRAEGGGITMITITAERADIAPIARALGLYG